MTSKDIQPGACVRTTNPLTREASDLYIREIRDGGKVVLAKSPTSKTGTRWGVPANWLLEHGALIRSADRPPAPGKRKPKPEVQPEVSRVMAEMGRRGGRIGGKRRADNMSAEERSNAACAAARARWRKAKGA